MRRAYVLAVVGLAIFLAGLALWRRPPIVFEVQASVAYQQTQAIQDADGALALASFERELRSSERLSRLAETLGLAQAGETVPIVEHLSRNLSVEAAPEPGTSVTVFKLGIETTNPKPTVELVQGTIESVTNDFDMPNPKPPQEVEAADYRISLARETVAKTELELEEYLARRIKRQPLPAGIPDPLENMETAAEPPGTWSEEDWADAEDESSADEPSTTTLPVKRNLQQPGLEPQSAEEPPSLVAPAAEPDSVTDTEDEPSPSDVRLPSYPETSAQGHLRPGPLEPDGYDTDQAEAGPATTRSDAQSLIPSHLPARRKQRPLIIDPNAPHTGEDCDDCKEVGDAHGQVDPIAPRSYPPVVFVAYEEAEPQPFGEAAFDRPVLDPPALDNSERAEQTTEVTVDEVPPDTEVDLQYTLLERQLQRAQEELRVALAAKRELLSAGSVDEKPKTWVAEPAFIASSKGESITPRHLVVLLGLSLIVGAVFSLLHNPSAANLLSTSREVRSATSLPVVATLGSHRLASVAAKKNRQLFVKWTVVAAEGVLVLVVALMVYFAAIDGGFARRIVENPLTAFTEAVGRVVETDDVRP